MQIPSQRQQQPVSPVQVRPATTPSVTPREAAPEAAGRPGSPDASKLASNLARLDGLAEALMDRLRSAAGDMHRGEFPAFREAAGQLESGLARLRAGLADGTLEPLDVQRGVGALFENVSAVLREGSEPAADAAAGADEAPVEAPSEAARPARAEAAPAPAEEEDAVDVGEVVRSRFAGFAETVQARLEAAEFPDQKRDAMAAGVAEAFASATARLDAALFDPVTGDPIDRGAFQQLFAASFSALQEQLSFLFEPAADDAGSRGVVYGSDRLAEGLSPRTDGLDVAG